MKILVTGGAGFIGSNFVRYILREHPGYKVVNLDKLTYAGNLENLKEAEGNPNYTFVNGDILDAKLISSLLEGTHLSTSHQPLTTVINFAAESHVDRSIEDPASFVRTNVLGTQVLLDCARKAWVASHQPPATSNRFIQVSTDEVYGSLGPTGYFTEETPLAPNSPYSASKAGADMLVRSYHETFGFPAMITRCSNNYGPYQFPEKLIPLMVTNALEGKALPVYGDGKNVRDWLHVEDHCRAIDAVLHKGKDGEVYNIGGNNEWKNIDIVNLICDILDSQYSSHLTVPSSRSLITFVKDRPGHDRRYAIDSSKIKKELGWTPTYTFETGLRETVDWFLSNRDWWQRIKSGEYKEYYERNYLKR